MDSKSSLAQLRYLEEMTIDLYRRKWSRLLVLRPASHGLRLHHRLDRNSGSKMKISLHNQLTDIYTLYILAMR